VISLSALLLVLAAPPVGLCSSPGGDPGGAGPVCSPADDPALRAQLAPLLGTIDRPVTTEQWRRLPLGARAVLEALASDPTALTVRRARALEGLAALGGDGSLHRRLAEDGAVPYAVRYSAVCGLGVVLPTDQREGALNHLLTRDPDRRIRSAAAATLARTAPAAGCGIIRAQVQREGTDGRLAFRRALAACGGR
jgi:hypothetical protein